MRKPLNTSTALIASLSLFAGGPAFPQEGAPADVPMVCADGSDQPCPEGVPLVPAPVPEAVSEPLPETAPEAVPAEPAAPEPASGAVTPPEPAPEEPAPEAAPDTGAPAEVVPQGAAPAAAAPVEPAAPEVAPEPSPEATSESAPEPAPEVQPGEPAVTEPAPQPEAATGAPEAAAESAITEPATTEPATTEPATTAPESTAPDAPAAEAPAEEPPAQPASEASDADAGATGDVGTDATTEPQPELPVQPDAATGEAPVAAAAEAGADAQPPADAQVTEELVTEETARSSDEDFANPVNQPAATQPAAAAPAAGSDDDGLSGGEKAVLLGLGALAVGAILSNNRRVQLNSGDRVVLERPDGSYQIIKDDNALLRRPGSTVRTERFADGSTRTIVTRADGSQIVTIRDAEYRVLRRAHVAPDGTQTLLVDDTVAYLPVDVTRLPPPAPAIEIDPYADEAALRAALSRRADFDRAFSLAQVRDIEEVRALVPVIDLTAITFETGSAAIRPDQAEALARLGNLMRSYIDANPREMFLIEGHTDAVGSAASNLALSDRRAESVALAMTEYFDVPPENLVVQGYGEEFLKVPTQGPERQNRRASVRRITDLLRQAAN